MAKSATKLGNALTFGPTDTREIANASRTIRFLDKIEHPSKLPLFCRHARAVLISSAPAVDAIVLNLMSGSALSRLIDPARIPKRSDLK
jgi:hypothetical protein